MRREKPNSKIENPFIGDLKNALDERIQSLKQKYGSPNTNLIYLNNLASKHSKLKNQLDNPSECLAALQEIIEDSEMVGKIYQLAIKARKEFNSDKSTSPPLLDIEPKYLKKVREKTSSENLFDAKTIYQEKSDSSQNKPRKKVQFNEPKFSSNNIRTKFWQSKTDSNSAAEILDKLEILCVLATDAKKSMQNVCETTMINVAKILNSLIVTIKQPVGENWYQDFSKVCTNVCLNQHIRVNFKDLCDKVKEISDTISEVMLKSKGLSINVNRNDSNNNNNSNMEDEWKYEI